MADNHTSAELSAQFRDASRFWIQRVFVPLVVGIGLLGNVVTIVVLTRRRMRSSTNMYLTALAVSDLLYLLFVFTLSFKHYPNICEPSFLLYWQYYGFGIWFTDATMTTPLEYEATVIQDPTDNSTLVSCVNFTQMAGNETYRTVFYWFTTITFVFVPLILLGIFNSFLIHAVHKSQQQRCRMTQVEQSDSIQTQENKITIILIAVVILFMVCQIPTAITLIYDLFHQIPESLDEENIRLGLGNIFNFLVTINAACNFMLYCVLSDKYRRTFLLTFLPSCYHPPSPSRHNTVYSSMYDGPSTLRRSVRTSSVHVPALSCDNGKMFRHASNYSARKQKNEGQLPLHLARNNVPSLLVESHLSLSSSIPN